MSYRLEIEGSHAFGLDGSLTEEEVVQRYSARIIAFDEDHYNGVLAGNAEFYIVRVTTAANNRISLTEAIDSINQDVYEYGAAVLDPETDDIRDDFRDRFDYLDGDLMFLHMMTILPAHRGRNVGLVAASRLIDCYANGLVVCRPQPLQHVDHRATAPEDGGMEYQRFSTDRREAKQKLQGYWGRLGFEAIDDNGIYALGTARALPTVKIRSRAPSRRMSPTTAKAQRKRKKS